MMPLKPPDAAQLLADLSPRRFMFSELGIPEGSSRESIASASENHPVMEDLEGHPGTMVRMIDGITKILGPPCLCAGHGWYSNEFHLKKDKIMRNVNVLLLSFVRFEVLFIVFFLK